MPKRTLCIQNPATLSVKDAALLIQQGATVVARVPLEDMWALIVETRRAQITTAALSALMEAGVSVMVCGGDHMPNGLLLPLGLHSRHAAVVESQLTMSKPLMKRLWQRIVVAKIENQAEALALLGIDGGPLRSIAKMVQSGDATNRESVAASGYFKKLLPEGGRREGAYAASLDYGYSVLRAGVGRCAVGGGWLVSRGIHHRNELNAFNLVDDLIEPFRPVVDLLAVQRGLCGELTPEIKRNLASVFEYAVKTPHGLTSVQAAIELEVDSFKTAVLEDDASLLCLPELVALARVEPE